MFNTADAQVRLRSAPTNPVISVEDLLDSNGCEGFSMESSRGIWSARAGIFSRGRFLICTPTEAFAMRVESSKDQTLLVVPLRGSSPLLQNGWEMSAKGFGISTSDTSVVLHAKGPANFALIWVSHPLPQAPDSSRAMIVNSSPERKKISINSDAETSAAQIEQLVGELTGFLANGFQAESKDSLANQPRRLVNRLSLVLNAWNQFENKVDADFEMPSIANWNNVSLRTLEYAFHEIVGRAPIVFLRQMRLHRARRLILSGKVPNVKTAAIQSGMVHFGRFSVDYRIQFGELARMALKSAKAKKPRTPAGK